MGTHHIQNIFSDLRKNFSNPIFHWILIKYVAFLVKNWVFFLYVSFTICIYMLAEQVNTILFGRKNLSSYMKIIFHIKVLFSIIVLTIRYVRKKFIKLGYTCPRIRIIMAAIFTICQIKNIFENPARDMWSYQWKIQQHTYKLLTNISDSLSKYYI